jgi:nucleoid DNA-binding protein
MGNTVNKTEIARQAAQVTPGITQETMNAAIGAVLDTITLNVEAGNSVVFKSFGTFKAKVMKARKARNPGTGAIIDVPEKTKMVFKVSVPG